MAISEAGLVFKYDISVPVHTAMDLVARVRQRIEDHGLHKKYNVKAFGYGHLGKTHRERNMLIEITQY